MNAEVRLSVDTELSNTFLTVEGTDDWRYFQSGSAGVSFLNKGSRRIRGELVLDFEGTGGTGGSTQEPTIDLRRFYLRPGIGPVLLTLGKTRSTWGAGLIFNAGDLIFGSDTVGFSAGSEDPRDETAWLVNAEIPLGAFSFVEVIALPGTGDTTAEGYDTLPPLSSASAGTRLSHEMGFFHVQIGYLYRGDAIAGLDSTGHRAFLSLEGIEPVNWHLSTSATASPASLRDSWMISGGASESYTVAYVMSLSWRFEFLLLPGASFSPVSEMDAPAEGSVAELYGLYLYPSISFSPRDNLSVFLNSILSPVDLSANSALGVDWNIYEALILSASTSVQTGETGDVFHPGSPGGISCNVGARYRY